MEVYYPMIKDALGMFLFLGLELSVLFLLISAAVSLLQQYIPDTKIQAILSGQKGRGYIFAALLGAVTPFCSCSTIPMLRGLLKAKAGFGPTLTFLFTSPLLNPIIIGLFIATFGMKVTIIYTGIALGVSIIAGVILAQMRFDRYVIPELGNEAASCCDSKSKGTHPNEDVMAQSDSSSPLQGSCCATKPAPATFCCAAEVPTPTPCCAQPSPFTASPSAACCAGSARIKEPSQVSLKVQQAFKDAWGQFKTVFPYLLLGVALGSFVYGFVPSEFIATYASGDSLFAVPIAAVIGIPLYVRAEALIPLSAVLAAKGMGLGAIMALIIGGAGASLTEVILLKSMFRTPMIVAFLVVILGMAIFAGYLFQFVL